MTPEAFRRFAELLPDAMALVSGDGTILALNRPFAERVERASEAMVGTPLAAITADPSRTVDIVRGWVDATRPTPAVLAIARDGDVLQCRAEGATVEPAADAAHRRILVRLPAAPVDQQVRALAAEIAHRRDVERALRQRETELREIADAMPQMVWTARPDGPLDSYNRRWHDYTGLTLRDSLGSVWEAVIHPEDLPTVLGTWEEARRNGREVTLEARFRRVDGIYRWHLCRTVPVRDDDGHIVRWIGTGTDIEDGKRAEEDRRVSAQRWQFLAQASTALAGSLDYEQVLRTVARLSVPAIADWCSVDVVEADGSVRRVGVAHADPTNRDILDRAATYPPDPDGRHPRTGVLRTGRSVLIREVPPEALERIATGPAHLEALRRLAYRSVIIVAVAARGRTLGALTYATTAESGRRYGPEDLALAENLAHRAGLAVDNARLYAEAQEASRLKDEFLATVSHELRTPLSSMMNWVALLQQGKIGPEQVKKGLDVLKRSGEAQARLIDDILDVSHIVSGRLRLQVQDVELGDVVRGAVETVRPAADARHVRLDVAPDDGTMRLVGDPARLRQVMWNLLANAVKFTPAGGAVSVRVARAGDEASIEIRDTGQGITEEFLPYVFDRFWQAERVANRRLAGLGLGLAIVKHVVEAHGGRVEARSAGPGQGATFVVRLPLPPAA